MLMRKNYVLLIVLFCGLFFSYNCTAQSNPQTEVLKLSLGLKEFQQKIPVAIQEKMPDFLILNSGPNFVFEKDLEVSGKSVKLISHLELAKHQSEGYFVFDLLTIAGDSAKVNYKFIYQSNGEDAVIPVELLLNKVSGVWKVVDSKF